ncbi:MAG: hypothetical protein RLZ47_1467 [Bacteroidota bacterium]
MFKDYYHILEVEFGATDQEIKTSYKRLARKWHPDLNPGLDTHVMMQELNEAYLILKDPEAKLRYDQEYFRFKNFGSSSQSRTESEQAYVFQDEILKKWMKNAKNQAMDLATQSLENLQIGVNAAGKEMAERMLYYLIIGFIVSLIVFLIKNS